MAKKKRGVKKNKNTNRRNRRKNSSISNTENPNLNKWSNLPPDLLELILKKLASNCGDLIRFGAVCSSWNHARQSCPKSSLVVPPWLMVLRCSSIADEHRHICTTRTPTRVFIPAEKKVYTIQNENILDILDDESARCAGSSHGSLLMFNNKTQLVHLVNPISGSIIQLPSISTLNSPGLTDFDIQEAAVTYCNNNFLVAIIVHGDRLAVYKHGQDDYAWTELTYLPRNTECYDEIAFCNGRLFASYFYRGESGREDWFQVWDVGETFDSYPKKIMEFESFLEDVRAVKRTSTEQITHTWEWNLVDSMGDVLFVEMVRIRRGPSYPKYHSMHYFYVYKLNLATKMWENVECLPGRALCLNRDDPNMPVISISTSSCPEFEDNSIYLSCDRDDAGEWQRCVFNTSEDINWDVRGLVYNLDSKMFKSFCKPPVEWSIRSTSAAKWFVPNLWEG